MSVMAQLAKFDTSLQRGLDNALAFVFGGKVVPAEIEELLKQEIQDNLTVDEDNVIYAPNVFAVGTSSKDLENLSRDRDLPSTLAEQMARYARNNGWEMVSAPVVRIAEESGLRTGQLRLNSYLAQEPDVASGFDAIETEPEQPSMDNQNQPHFDQEYPPTQGYGWAATPSGETPTPAPANSRAQQPDPQPEPQDGPTVNLLLQDGSSRTYQVREGSNILGRSNEADFRLPDTGVSRQHAEITWDGQDAVLVDLQSTNGTTVNDNPIDNWLLGDGDVITMGHSHIEVRIIFPGKR